MLDSSRLNFEKIRLNCLECINKKWTVSNCSSYKYIKNCISASKKYFEILQVGTIVPVSEHPREIKEMGWQLRFFDDVKWTDA